MAYEIIRAYKVYETIDEYGRHGAIVGIFQHSAEANEAAENKGWYGGKGTVLPVSLISVDGKLFELAIDVEVDLNRQKAKADAKLKAETLASLTAEQRRVLGLK